MRKFTLVLLLINALLLGSGGMLTVRAQAACGCDFVISLNNSEYQFFGNQRGVQPGDTICLTSGTRWGLGFFDVHGTAANPVVITNMCDGQVNLSSPSGWGNSVSFERCSNIKFTGSNNPNVEYGIKVSGASHGVNFQNFTTDFEIDHVWIESVGSCGLVAKTDPTCDPATWRGSGFVMRNGKIHHNYIANTVDEGIYVGNSHYDGTATVNNCNGTTIHPLETSCDNVEIYENTLYHLGNEAIQVGGTTHARIHHNKIDQFAVRKNAAHDNGIQCGGGTEAAQVYNNVLNHGNNCFYDSGGGGSWYNNVCFDGATGGFIIQDLGTLAPTGNRIINNTLINVGSPALMVYNLNTDTSLLINNIIVGVTPASGPYVYLKKNNPSGNRWRDANNIKTTNITTVGFVDAVNEDFHLANGSAGIDGGLNMSAYGVTFDLDESSRPLGSAFDIGAYEFIPSAVPAVSRFNFSPSPQTVTDWINLAGAPHAAVITATDVATGISVTSVATNQWNPGVFSGVPSSSYDGGVTNGTVQPAAVVLSNWFNYNAPYGATVGGVVQGDNIRVSGLIANHTYTLQVGASRRSGGPGDQYGAMEYRFNGTNAQQLTVTNNATNQVQVTATSDGTGRIGISARKVSGSALNFGYIGWLVVTEGTLGSLQARMANGVEEPVAAIDKTMKIYPNPANTYFVADLRSFHTDETVQISLVNMMGQSELLSTAKGGQLHRVETDRVTSGVFTVVLRSNRLREIQKVIINK